MAICTLKTDHPIRVQFGPGLVVHAAQESAYGGFHRYTYRSGENNGSEWVPKSIRIHIACSYSKVEERHVVANTTAITCKKCAKKLGFDKAKSSPKRFVVINNETGEYYKGNSRCTNWVEDILDATLYKVKATAKSRTKRTYFSDGDGRQLSHNEFYRHDRRTRAEKGFTSKHMKSSKYDVQTVTITVD